MYVPYIFLHHYCRVTIISTYGLMWTDQVKINGFEVDLKLDTGSQLNVPLNSSMVIIKIFGGFEIKSVGKIIVEIISIKSKINVVFEIVTIKVYRF